MSIGAFMVDRARDERPVRRDLVSIADFLPQCAKMRATGSCRHFLAVSTGATKRPFAQPVSIAHPRRRLYLSRVRICPWRQRRPHAKLAGEAFPNAAPKRLAHRPL